MFDSGECSASRPSAGVFYREQASLNGETARRDIVEYERCSWGYDFWICMHLNGGMQDRVMRTSDACKVVLSLMKRGLSYGGRH